VIAQTTSFVALAGLLTVWVLVGSVHGLFARDGERAGIEGGLVIGLKSGEAQQERTFAKLAGLLRTEAGEDVQPVRIPGAATAFRVGRTDAGTPLFLARAKDRWVLAGGEGSAAAALRPGTPLSESPLYEEGKAVLGGDNEPSFLLSMPAVVKAVERAGEADAEFEKARPYLEAFSLIVSGGSSSEDEIRTRTAAALK